MIEYLINLRSTSSGIIDLAGNTWTGIKTETYNKVPFSTASSNAIRTDQYTYTYTSSTKFQIDSSSDYTISLWMNLMTLGDWWDSLFSISYSGIYSLGIICNWGSVQGLGVKNDGTANTPIIWITNANNTLWSDTTNWHHYAMTKQGYVYRLFKDGIKIGETTSTTTVPQTNYAYIGGAYVDTATGRTHSARYNDVVFLKGKALWTSNFTVPKTYVYDEYYDKLYMYDSYKDNNNYLYGYK